MKIEELNALICTEDGVRLVQTEKWVSVINGKIAEEDVITVYIDGIYISDKPQSLSASDSADSL